MNELLGLTVLLEKTVLDEESDPEKWIELLDKRQEVMDQLSGLFVKGISLTETQKQTYFQPAYEVDKRIIPIMDREKKKLESQIANVQKNKIVNQQYGGYGTSYSPHGAFFDKKK
ncbi:hypothetical protein GK047_22830 [Paenibacillus sp. SYP-B3998]|uniref:Flagellar protein FliT n=1 Tax=Paenibacillus sp. SYP-B3998 TaxID=2678564 RepID=A0A6G4A2W2_9BACL|nr:hypothetical protein [Paenibacillus sp. SYP-B3998]NEW08836.1 hypothetical protein [Paenibacillus sp. SYP-B3998]